VVAPEGERHEPSHRSVTLQIPDVYRRPIEPPIVIIFGCLRRKCARFKKCDGEKGMIGEQLRSCLQRRWSIVPKTSPLKRTPSTVRCPRSRVQVIAVPYKPQECSWVHVVAWSQQGLNAMGKLVADIIVETLQNAGAKHCYGVVGDTLNLIARSLEKSKIEWVSVRHEEAGAFAARKRR
jgi:thiamine pyrophosphate-dependent enzyme